MKLTPSQKSALDHVNSLAKGAAIDLSLRITLNFHPDRTHGGLHILESMVHTGVYKSQFETNTSNGGLTAHPGGDRWSWESRIFGNAYDNAEPNERPKYGALNYKRSQYGGSPRFGSAHLRLNQDMLSRATFCYPDSVFGPETFGTASSMELIAIALTDEKDLLDDYIEAQIHGVLRIDNDVEALVLDPSYKGTDVERMAKKLNCGVEWHDGFMLPITEMEQYPEYRGIEYVKLGQEIAQDDVLTPYIIGLAARSGKYDLLDIKKVWHYLARFGQK